jgi:hypothetical protein
MKAALVPQSATTLCSAFQMLGNTTAALSQVQKYPVLFYSSLGVSAQIKTDLARRRKTTLTANVRCPLFAESGTFTDNTSMSNRGQRPNQRGYVPRDADGSGQIGRS